MVLGIFYAAEGIEPVAQRAGFGGAKMPAEACFEDIEWRRRSRYPSGTSIEVGE